MFAHKIVMINLQINRPKWLILKGEGDKDMKKGGLAVFLTVFIMLSTFVQGNSKIHAATEHPIDISNIKMSYEASGQPVDKLQKWETFIFECDFELPNGRLSRQAIRQR